MIDKGPNGKQTRILKKILRETDIERETENRKKERKRQKMRVLGTLLDRETAIERK